MVAGCYLAMLHPINDIHALGVAQGGRGCRRVVHSRNPPRYGAFCGLIGDSTADQYQGKPD